MSSASRLVGGGIMPRETDLNVDTLDATGRITAEYGNFGETGSSMLIGSKSANYGMVVVAGQESDAATAYALIQKNDATQTFVNAKQVTGLRVLNNQIIKCAAGSINLYKPTTVTGDLTVSGDLTMANNNANIHYSGDMTIVPASGNTNSDLYVEGSSVRLHGSEVDLVGVTTTITGTTTTITGDTTTITGQTTTITGGTTTITGNATIGGNLTVSGQVTASNSPVHYSLNTSAQTFSFSENTYNTIMATHPADGFTTSNWEVNGGPTTVNELPTGYYLFRMPLYFSGTFGNVGFGLSRGIIAGTLYVQGGTNTDSDLEPKTPVQTLTAHWEGAVNLYPEFRWQIDKNETESNNKGYVLQMKLVHTGQVVANFTSDAVIDKIELVRMSESDLFDALPPWAE